MTTPFMLHGTLDTIHSVAGVLATRQGIALDVKAAQQYVAAIEEYRQRIQALSPDRAQALEAKVGSAAQYAAEARTHVQQGNWFDGLEKVYSAIGALPGEPGLWPRKIPRPTRR